MWALLNQTVSAIGDSSNSCCQTTTNINRVDRALLDCIQFKRYTQAPCLTWFFKQLRQCQLSLATSCQLVEDEVALISSQTKQAFSF
jgi:hypothetical protein